MTEASWLYLLGIEKTIEILVAKTNCMTHALFYM